MRDKSEYSSLELLNLYKEDSNTKGSWVDFLDTLYKSGELLLKWSLDKIYFDSPIYPSASYQTKKLLDYINIKRSQYPKDESLFIGLHNDLPNEIQLIPCILDLNISMNIKIKNIYESDNLPFYVPDDFFWKTNLIFEIAPKTKSQNSWEDNETLFLGGANVYRDICMCVEKNIMWKCGNFKKENTKRLSKGSGVYFEYIKDMITLIKEQGKLTLQYDKINNIKKALNSIDIELKKEYII